MHFIAAKMGLVLICLVIMGAPEAVSETCADANERLSKIGTQRCDVMTYAGQSTECILFQNQVLDALQSLRAIGCPSPSSAFTVEERILETSALIEQMRKYPNGPSDMITEIETMRTKEIRRLEQLSKKKTR